MLTKCALVANMHIIAVETIKKKIGIVDIEIFAFKLFF